MCIDLEFAATYRWPKSLPCERGGSCREDDRGSAQCRYSTVAHDGAAVPRSRPIACDHGEVRTSLLCCAGGPSLARARNTRAEAADW
jgi:hypothetical protein